MPAEQPKQPVQPVPAVSQEAAENTMRTQPTSIRLPLGVALDEAEALKIAADRPVCMVILAGAVGCGKTTLLTSLYEMFQCGPIEKITFAGCKTLPAFEQRCHLSRIESEKPFPDTLRTQYEDLEPEYLHLRVKTGREDDEFVDFLFTDVSGEMFEHARNSTDECKQLLFLNRANHFLIFLDCEKALQADKRWDMVQEVKSLLQSCLDSSMFSPRCNCTIVWSKYDFFAALENKAGVENFVTQVQNELSGMFSNRIPSLKFHRTAARPTRHPGLKMGFGVKELLHDWIAALPTGRAMRLEPPLSGEGSRESEKFALRQNLIEQNK